MEISEIQPLLVAEFTRILQRQILNHAYLFSGGFGGMEMAIWLSQAVFCQDPQDHLPCGKCRACRLVAGLEFADLHVVEPDGQTIKTAQIRELTTVFSESGFEGQQKVVIIKSAEKMHPNAANALLKSIEEPSSEVYIFLLTDNENLILPTIRSRTQVVHFPKNSRYLQDFLEQNGLLPTQAELLSQVCDSTDQALAVGQAAWFAEGLQRLDKFVQLLAESTSEAFLYLANLTETFDDKDKQRLAFSLLLQLLNQKKMTAHLEKTFKAMKMWQSNVRFESCLTLLAL